MSPMVGTFYRAGSPESPPFVDVGNEVTEETVVCIIEAMKVMNEIKAEIKGVIAEVVAENGKASAIRPGAFPRALRCSASFQLASASIREPEACAT